MSSFTHPDGMIVLFDCTPRQVDASLFGVSRRRSPRADEGRTARRRQQTLLAHARGRAAQLSGWNMLQ